MDFVTNEVPWGDGRFEVGTPTPTPDNNFCIVTKQKGHTQFVAKDKEAAEKLLVWLRQIVAGLESQIESRRE